MAIENLITNKTKIIELSKEQYGWHSLCRKTGVRKDVCECWNDWYYYQNKWYYFKNFSCGRYASFEFKLINELIGEYLAEYLNVDVIHYEIAKLGNQYGLASQNFIKKGNRYYFSKDIDIPSNYANTNNLILLGYKCQDNQNYLELLNEIYKLLAIDIYMNQSDRSYSNYQFRKEKGKLHLAPIYDFEESFCEPFKSEYHSSLLGMSVDDINKFQYLRYFIIQLLELDINNVLETISFEKEIVIPDNYIKYYNDFIEDRKMLLDSSLNKNKVLVKI